RGEILGVADHGIYLAARRADIAGDHLAEMNADTDREWPARALVDALHGDKHFARGRDRPVRGILGLEWRAEQRQETIAEKLVHDAAMSVEDLDQHGERAIESIDDILRRARARACRKAAEVDEHHRDPANIAP